MEEYKYFVLIFHVLGVCEVIVPRAGKPSFFQTKSHVTRKSVFLFPAGLSPQSEPALSSCRLGSRPQTQLQFSPPGCCEDQPYIQHLVAVTVANIVSFTNNCLSL